MTINLFSEALKVAFMTRTYPERAIKIKLLFLIVTLIFSAMSYSREQDEKLIQSRWHEEIHLTERKKKAIKTCV